MVMELRPYQREAVDAVYEHLRLRDDNPCVVIPTGSGKTIILSTICRDTVQLWNGRILILAHVKELLEQAVDKLNIIAPDLREQVGVYSAGLNSRDTDHPIIVAGIQSIYKRAAELDAFDLILVDECHLLPPDGEGMYRTFLADARKINPNVRLIGLTATPYRMSSGMICAPENLLNQVCYEAGVKELIVQGYLCPLKSKAGKKKPDTSGLHVRGGEFIASEVESLMDEHSLVSSACSEIIESSRQRRSVLIFASGIEHARHIQQTLRTLTGEDVGLVTGDTPATERARLLARFKGETVATDLFGGSAGPLKYLVNVNVLTTGFDAPNIDCVVLLRPTNSPGNYCQMVGRGFRLHPGKTDCQILDFGGNILRHGPVDALELKPGPDRGNGEAPARECPECQALIHAAYATCPECGYEFAKPEKQNHEAQASTAGVLSGQIEDNEYDVDSVSYHYHIKRGGTPDDPPTMRVEYQLGWRLWKSEWVCFEHKGFARKKAENWWRMRSNEPVPDTVQEAIELAETGGALAETLAITVRSVSGEKFDRIIDYVLGPKPPRLDGSDERDDGNLPDYAWIEDESLPF